MADSKKEGVQGTAQRIPAVCVYGQVSGGGGMRSTGDEQEDIYHAKDADGYRGLNMARADGVVAVGLCRMGTRVRECRIGSVGVWLGRFLESHDDGRSRAVGRRSAVCRNQS